MAQILQPTPPHLDTLAGHLSAGEIVAIPTETVYGLAGNALDPEAIAKIYAAKGRPANNPLIIHICSQKQLADIAIPTKSAEKLAEKFWPGPLTLILKKKPIVPDSVTAGLDTVAVRMPSHPIYLELAKRCTFPLAAPSANPFGYVSPTRAEHVEAQMGQAISWILDGGACEAGIESTIVSLLDSENPLLLRHGSISLEELENTLDVCVRTLVRTTTEEESLISPGLMKRHYSPNTPIRLFSGDPPIEGSNDAVVFLNLSRCTKGNHFSLSSCGNLQEVARNLYDKLQKLDQKGFETIFLELPETTGIGRAICDRMNRAAAQD